MALLWSMKGQRMSFIMVWKVVGELHSPKNMMSGSKSPWFVEKAAFHLSPSVTPVTHQPCASALDPMLTPMTHQPHASASDPMRVRTRHNGYVRVDRVGRDQERTTNRTEQF